MKLLFYVFANKYTGLGHWFRSMRLVDEAVSRGHTCYVVTDKKQSSEKINYHLHSVSMYNFVGWRQVFYTIKPDWAVFDLSIEPPQDIYELPTRTCSIDGIGHKKNGFGVVINQSLEGTYCAPDYLILKRDLVEAAKQYDITSAQNWFVFGGAADRMGLCDRFMRMNPNGNNILFPYFDVMNLERNYRAKQDRTKYRGLFDNISTKAIQLMLNSNKACIAMGMTAWELAYLKMPTYAFSLTERHLASAKLMGDAGYLTYYSITGLPTNDKNFMEFISNPMVFRGKPIEDVGATNTIKLLERSGGYSK